MLVLASLAHAGAQALHGNLLLAAGVAAAALTTANSLRCWLWTGGPSAPRALHLAADGQMHLRTGEGGLMPVALLPGSVRLGSHLLLHLQVREGRRYRLCLGPDNLDSCTLAALRRRLRRPPATPGLLG